MAVLFFFAGDHCSRMRHPKQCSITTRGGVHTIKLAVVGSFPEGSFP